MQVLLELGQVLGAFRDRFVVVGGSVPWLLYPEAEPPHIGTLDIDLGLDAHALGNSEDYAELVETLEKSGFKRCTDLGATDLKQFQLRREIVVDNGRPVAVLVDLLRPEGKLKKRKLKRLSGFRVQEIPGLEIALREFVEHRVDGVMPDGRPNSVMLHVANIPAFLVLKGYAIDRRNKRKDAYDIYFAIRNFPGGPVALADDCRRLLAMPVARKAYEYIAEKFTAEASFGPITVRDFLTDQQALAEMTAEQIQVDAYRQVRSWVLALQLRHEDAT
jgi:hypothetical protein